MTDARPTDSAGQRPTPLVPLSLPGHAPRVELPRSLTSFVGREREVAAVRAQLVREDVPLLTLTGPGGVGKTRLALQVAEELAGDASPFPDGVWFVPLAPVRDAGLVASVVAQTLGVRESGDRPLVAALVAAVRERRLLVLLDNFEHVLAAAPLLTDLLTACPRLTVLVTSRERLRLSGEHTHRVPPLSIRREPGEQPVSPPDSRLPTPDSDAVRLFVDRARSAEASFTLTAANAGAIAAICQHLDGLPLAIELAAAQTRVLPPPELRVRLEQRLPVLTGGPRDAPARLQTMRDAIAWSYDLLTPDEQALFRRLAIFVGGFTVTAAEAIVGRRETGVGREIARASLDSRLPSPVSVLDGIAALVDRSLLQPDTQDPEAPAGHGTPPQPRFGMLETIREFGLEQLAAGGETAEIWRRHAVYFLALAEEAEPRLRGPDQIAWLEWLETDLPNLRAALGWLRETGDTASGLRFAAALWTFWVVHDHVPEGRRWLDAFLAAAPPGSAERLNALVALGDMCERQGDYATAAAWTEEVLALARSRGDRARESAALRGLGNIAMARGEVARHDLEDETLATEEFTRAEVSLEQSLALARELGDEWGAAKATHWLAIAIGLRGDDTQAIACCEAAVAAFRRLGDQRQLCNVLWNLASAARHVGDLPRARAALAESLALARQIGYGWHGGLCLVSLGNVAADSGEFERAAWLLGAAAALREATGEPLRPSVQSWHDRTVAAARAAIGESGFAAAWTAGATLPPDAAIAEALAWASLDTTLPAQPASPAAHDHLTPREHEVLRLLTEGMSDKEIAATLYISRRTASKHVAAIRAKLGLPSRAAAAAYATRHRLV